METCLSMDYIKEFKTHITKMEKHFEKLETLIQEEEKSNELLSFSLLTGNYSDEDYEILQKVKKMKQDAFESLKKIKEMSKEALEREKTLIQVFDTSNLASKLATESLSKFFLSSSLLAIDKDFVLKNSHYDMENDCFTGLIKNEKNNKVAYFIVNGNNHNPLFHLVALKNENELPDYQKNEQDWIGEEVSVSKLVDLLK